MCGIDEINNYLKNNLSKKRYVHSLNVADESAKIAGYYNANTHKAYLAGLVHDICKEFQTQELQKLVSLSKLQVSSVELETKSLWHAIAGAVFIYEKFGINDNEIIDAVRYHTVGRAGMSVLEEIVYLADLISIDREQKDVSKIRRLAYENLNQAMLEAMIYAISCTLKKRVIIPVSTLECYNHYANECGKQ